MSLLLDTSDSRRAGKTWLPPDGDDVSHGLVVRGPIEWDGRPECIYHGAMSRVLRDQGIYRCSQCGVGAEWYPTDSQEAKRAFSRAWDTRYMERAQEA